MKKRRFAAALLACVMALSLAACGANPERDIEALNRRFCRSYNNMDVEGVLDCLEPGMAESISAMFDLGLGLLGAAADVDVDLDAETMFALAQVCFNFMPEEERDSMQIPELDLEIESLELSEDGTEASAMVTMTLVAGSESASQTAEVYYVMIDDEWYFSNGNFQF